LASSSEGTPIIRRVPASTLDIAPIVSYSTVDFETNVTTSERDELSASSYERTEESTDRKRYLLRLLNSTLDTLYMPLGAPPPTSGESSVGGEEDFIFENEFFNERLEKERELQLQAIEEFLYKTQRAFAQKVWKGGRMREEGGGKEEGREKGGGRGGGPRERRERWENIQICINSIKIEELERDRDERLGHVTPRKFGTPELLEAPLGGKPSFAYSDTFARAGKPSPGPSSSQSSPSSPTPPSVYSPSARSMSVASAEPPAYSAIGRGSKFLGNRGKRHGGTTFSAIKDIYSGDNKGSLHPG
jgi:hypothetical protein